MHPGPGFRIREQVERPDPELVARFAEFETPSISDLMNRLYTMVTAIRNVTDPALGLCGPAVTVKVYPGDNLMVHKSLDIARPGDVVVVDPRAAAEEILDRLIARRDAEAAYTAAVARGEFSNAWVDAILDEAGLTE